MIKSISFIVLNLISLKWKNCACAQMWRGVCHDSLP